MGFWTASTQRQRASAGVWQQPGGRGKAPADGGFPDSPVFFEHRGFRIQAAQLVPVDGEDLENFQMQKVLEPIVSQETAE